MLEVNWFHPRSSPHRPETTTRILYDDQHLYVLFRVQDRYVRCIRTRYQDNVCGDSCVEFFVEPTANKGYFNFEINCGGVMLLYHVTDPKRDGNQLQGHRPVPPAWGNRVRVYHSLPCPIEQELQNPTVWTIEYAVPYALFEAFVGPVAREPGSHWSANFYKCGDETSHPHWASWAPVGDPLNFHKPERFGDLVFA